VRPPKVLQSFFTSAMILSGIGVDDHSARPSNTTILGSIEMKGHSARSSPDFKF
jgi:hypothetical protein